jgi:D-glycero-D-manno-heptose 1,7-bisphosphate phosphatase
MAGSFGDRHEDATFMTLPPSPSSRRGLVLDRDGTIIEHVPYLCDPDGVVLLPGVREALRAARSAGVDLFVHSNQSGVGRGMFGLDAVDACNRRMIRLLDLGEQPFVRICVAPEAPEAPAIYRKPSPRFAQELIRDFGFAPHNLAYVGDRGSDIETAARAGVRGIGVATGLDDLRAELTELGLDGEFPVFASLSEAVDHFLNTPQ